MTNNIVYGQSLDTYSDNILKSEAYSLLGYGIL
jgi:hypothetical protein